MRATPSLAIIAAGACLGQQIARAQRVAAADWGNKDCNQKLQTAIFGSREKQLWFWRGKSPHFRASKAIWAAVRAKPELSKYFLVLIRGPWRWPMLQLHALKQTREATCLECRPWQVQCTLCILDTVFFSQHTQQILTFLLPHSAHFAEGTLSSPWGLSSCPWVLAKHTTLKGCWWHGYPSKLKC